MRRPADPSHPAATIRRDSGTHLDGVMDPVDGTYTFVFTDIEGSTRLLQGLGDAYPTVLAQHDAIVRSAATEHGGRAFGSEGDAQYLVFGDVDSAIAAAVQAQRTLAGH